MYFTEPAIETMEPSRNMHEAFLDHYRQKFKGQASKKPSNENNEPVRQDSKPAPGLTAQSIHFSKPASGQSFGFHLGKKEKVEDQKKLKQLTKMKNKPKNFPSPGLQESLESMRQVTNEKPTTDINSWTVHFKSHAGPKAPIKSANTSQEPSLAEALAENTITKIRRPFHNVKDDSLRPNHKKRVNKEKAFDWGKFSFIILTRICFHQLFSLE